MPISGNTRLLSISTSIDGPFLVLEDQTSLEISSEMESIDANVKTDTHSKSLPGIQSGSISLDFNERAEDKVVQDQLYEAYLNRNLVYVEESRWSGVGNPADSAVPIARSEGFLTSYSRSAGMNEVITVSSEIELQQVWSVVGLDVTPASATIAATGTQQLTVADYDGTDVTASATYVSSDETVATVDASGLVSGVAAGTATITASYDRREGTSEITVS